jgi:stage II sporulation protein D
LQSNQITLSNLNKKYFLPIITGLLEVLKSRFILSFLFVIFILLTNCSSSERFTSDEKYLKEEFKPSNNFLRVLLDEKPASIELNIQNKVFLYNEREKVAEINRGNNVNFSVVSDMVNAKVGRENFYGKYFQLVSTDGEMISYNNKSFKGKLKIVGFGKYIDIINFIDLENYLKGVIAKEMPVGNGTMNFEALKAFAITARTYTLSKMNKGNLLFDLFADTRDQVYGGENAEELISSKAVEETTNMILYYNGQPATLYYHSTCGGVSENVENVFPQSPLPYLKSVIDGDDPNCKISPRFNWKEEFAEQQLITKLFNAGLISGTNYKLTNISILSKFESGRVNDLGITLDGNNGTKEIHIYGNEIRTIIKTPDKNLTLWSTMFTIEKLSNGNILFSGKGFGHGVGLCQWGAISQSQQGIEYKQILEHYFPGTELGRIND